MRTLIGGYRGTLKSAAQIAAAALLVICGGVIAMTVVMHLVDPSHFGLWWGPHAFFFGSVDTPLHIRQVNDSTLYQVALIVVPLCGLVGYELIGFVRERRGQVDRTR